MTGKVIALVGTSSTGKTSIVKILREGLSEPFCRYGVDMFEAGGFHPVTVAPQSNDARHAEVSRFTRGFNRSVAAFAKEGNDLIIELVLETQELANDLVSVLATFDTFWVGVKADEDVIRLREKKRGDRIEGTATHFLNCYSMVRTDLVVDTTFGVDDAAAEIMLRWQTRASIAGI